MAGGQGTEVGAQMISQYVSVTEVNVCVCVFTYECEWLAYTYSMHVFVLQDNAGC